MGRKITHPSQASEHSSIFLQSTSCDNAVNRIVAAGALKKYGAIVTCVDSGKEAISRLQPPHKFDACFMDVQMPEMDG